ncbi:glycosyltransferase family 2 protein [Sandarakinorhabdus sp. AAP62]|uniref:glycosyltransferase family 2 protein n=1 Tax=Sandarakinorhabdus sp. AAP62 TaxID=1248916 RepID=UPI0002EFAE68|nr:glycosyltransferase family 2 protein [Sandarakinorhabdus sp. AAP62]
MASLPASSPDQFRVSVIIPHFNMPDALARCLASVTGQQLDGAVEIIVVDNGSRQLPTEVVAQFPGVRLLSDPTPGPGPARNTGVAAAQAPVLAFIDADCRAGEGWLQAAVAAVEAGGNRAVVGGDVRIDFVDPVRLTPVEAYEAVFAYRQRMYIEQQGFSGTGNLAMHRDVHAAVGPFAGIGVAEDRDWGCRASAAGYRPVYVPAMRIYHPARTDVASLALKWQRHVAHDWAEHRSQGRPLWRWLLKAALMPASVLVDGGRMLFSQRLPGFSNKLRGMAVLARVRLLRGAEMLRVIGATGEDAGTHWHGGAA